FGLPGEENLDFLESLRTSSIKVIITRHEQPAAFMAATYGRLTGKAGVCFSTLGPGALNLVTGVAHAQLIGAPLVSISGQKALRANWQARFQLINVVEVMRPITKAHSPLIILSSGANRDPVCRQLTHFINRTGLYAIHTQMGKGVLSDESEYSLFATGIHRRDYVNCGIDRADLIITIGYNIVEYPPYVWNKNLDKKIINIDFAEAAVDKYYNPEIDIIGDISCALSQLGEMITHRENNGTFKSVREFLDRKLSPDFNKQYPLTPQEIVFRVREVLSHQDILTLDNGIYKLWFSRLYRTYGPNTFLLDNALATMGAGLSSGIMAKMLRPGLNVLAVVGD